MLLYLVRHGEAVPYNTPGISDDDRPLTDDGERRMRKAARGLKRLKVDPERILTSPLPRARRTAEIIAERLSKESVLEEEAALRADRDARSVRDWIGTRSEASLMIVGHNPTFSKLVGLLVDGSTDRPVCELEKGGVAALRTTDRDGFVLDWLASPRMLRKLR